MSEAFKRQEQSGNEDNCGLRRAEAERREEKNDESARVQVSLGPE